MADLLFALQTFASAQPQAACTGSFLAWLSPEVLAELSAEFDRQDESFCAQRLERLQALAQALDDLEGRDQPGREAVSVQTLVNNLGVLAAFARLHRTGYIALESPLTLRLRDEDCPACLATDKAHLLLGAPAQPLH